MSKAKELAEKIAEQVFGPVMKGHTLKEQRDSLLAACEAAIEHVTELREAWRTGALGDHDGGGGIRSNRNAEVEQKLRAAIESAEGHERKEPTNG